MSTSKTLAAFVTVGILSATTAALVAETPHRMTGRIKSFDLTRHVVTLDNGSTGKVARGVDIKRMKPGEKLALAASGFGGTIEASSIRPTVD